VQYRILRAWNGFLHGKFPAVRRVEGKVAGLRGEACERLLALGKLGGIPGDQNTISRCSMCSLDGIAVLDMAGKISTSSTEVPLSTRTERVLFSPIRSTVAKSPERIGELRSESVNLMRSPAATSRCSSRYTVL
jgi:hypothetical protein